MYELHSSALLQELKDLTGMRGAISLSLELLDFVAPIVQKIWSKAARAASWLLVFLIGRSLGLVFKGIKQSMGFRNSSRSNDRQPQDTQFA